MAEAFYLRFKPAEQRRWVRQNLFTTGYTPVFRFEEATAFASAAQATDFARLYKLEPGVELVSISAEGVDAA